MAGASETNVDRRERLRKLALETIDLAKVRVAFPHSNYWFADTTLGSLYPSQPPRLPRMPSVSDTTHK